jgi:hypothetical protein
VKECHHNWRWSNRRTNWYCSHKNCDKEAIALATGSGGVIDLTDTQTVETLNRMFDDQWKYKELCK